MTENFTHEELSIITNGEKAFKTAATVVLKNSQTLNILNAKVDTLGVTTVRQAKDNVSTLQTIKKNNDTINQLYEDQQDSKEKISHVAESIDHMLDIDNQNNTTIKEMRENIVALSGNIEQSKNQIITNICSTNETTKKHTENISSSIEQIKDELKRLDYKDDLTKINETIKILASNVAIYNTKSESNYESLSKQVQILELATANTVTTARTYHEGLVSLNNKVSEMLSRVTNMENQISAIKLKPSLSSHDDILKMFKEWDYEPEPEVVKAQTVEVRDTWATAHNTPEASVANPMNPTNTMNTVNTVNTVNNVNPETTVKVDLDFGIKEPVIEPSVVQPVVKPVTEQVVQPVVEEPVVEEKPKKKGFFGIFKWR